MPFFWHSSLVKKDFCQPREYQGQYLSLAGVKSQYTSPGCRKSEHWRFGKEVNFVNEWEMYGEGMLLTGLHCQAYTVQLTGEFMAILILFPPCLLAIFSSQSSSQLNNNRSKIYVSAWTTRVKKQNSIVLNSEWLLFNIFFR